ncbi:MULTISPECIES: glycosyltransferase family A protein [unclassified Streptomyces]|uniref:glycosyltransferase family 2 protein n=1 Tax=unclassified Streptomyces TaxID=2593676 RepID=UPI00278C0842|nr:MULTISPECIES: glycosyltransferase family A protein [unclassified Streptomyces]
MRDPEISIIIPVHNAMPYLTKCLDSVLQQTIGIQHIEVVAVDDGSTDDSGIELDRFAAQHPEVFRVEHQPASGGPAAPRNRGLELAKGRFVFFLDADDFLGPEALQRLLDAASRNGSDVVLGKMKGAGGRGVPGSMFRENQADADLFTSRVYWTLSALKLFRRSLIEKHQLRFPVELPNGSDQPFTGLAYLRAKRISVVADYDCYYAVRRDDGQHVTRSGGAMPRVAFLEQMCRLLSDEVPAGPKRDSLLLRHFQIDMPHVLRHLVRENDPEQQEILFARITDLVREHYSENIAVRLHPLLQMHYHIVAHGTLQQLCDIVGFSREKQPYEVTLQKDRVLALFPHADDPDLAVPLRCVDVTDHLSLHHRLTSYEFTGSELHLTGESRWKETHSTDGLRVTVVLRERGSAEVEYTTEAKFVDDNRFEATVDLLTCAQGAPLRDGIWYVFLRAAQGDATKTVRFGSRRAPGMNTNRCLHMASNGCGGIRGTAAYFTQPHGNLSLDLGEQKYSAPRVVHVDSANWSGTNLMLRGRIPAHHGSGDLALRVTEHGGSVRELDLPHQQGEFTTVIPMDRLGRGSWSLKVCADRSSKSEEWLVPATTVPTGIRWQKLFSLPAYAKPLPDHATLTFRVDSVRPWIGLQRRVSKVSQQWFRRR